MGVKSLWSLLTPVGRPVMLETMEGKAMAIDSSIWIYQFQATMRDKDGRALSNAHVLGFLRRICKLLFYGIKPVFVFDGGAPALKKTTLNDRRKKKAGAAASHVKLAEKLLAAQMRREALNQAQGPGKGKGKESAVVLDENTVYLEDIDPTVPKPKTPVAKRIQSVSPSKKNKFHDHDPYRLPEVDLEERVAKATRTVVPDPRLATEDELRAFIEDMRPEDFDVTSPAFRELPTEVQYEIVGDLRLKSRQSSHVRLQQMLKIAHTPLDFSKQQIKNLQQRNTLTQQLLTTTDSIGKAHISIPIRIASERNKEYVLVKNEGEGGGWVLGIRDDGTQQKPIVIDHDRDNEQEDDDSDDMEEVEIPSVAEVFDPDLRDYKRGLALSAIAGRQSPTKISRMITKHDQPKPSRPLFDMGNFAEDDWDEDDVMAFAIQESLDQAKVANVSETNPLQPEAGPSRRVDASSINQDRPSKRLSGSPLTSHMARADHDRAFHTATRLETALSIGNALPRNHYSPSTPSTSSFGTPYLLTSKRGTRDTFKDRPNSHEKQQLSLPETDPIGASHVDALNDLPQVSAALGREVSDSDDDMDEVLPVVPELETPEDNNEVDTSPQGSDDEMDEVVPPSIPTIQLKPDDVALELHPDDGMDIPSELHAAAKLDSDDAMGEMDIPSVGQSEPGGATLSIEQSTDEPSFSVATDGAPEDQSESSPLAVGVLDHNDELEPSTQWSRSSSPDGTPSKAHNTSRPASPAENWDAAQEMDADAEEGEFARFISQVKGRDLEDVRREIDDEIKSLHQQKKAAMRDAEDVTQQMVSQIMMMLRLFGIPYITAPMEAEAQCAELVALGLVDGIITDDSDVFLFGGQRVFKNMFNQSKTVECFLLTDLSRELGLDRDTLVRLAYLLGSDYVDGLPGVGPVVAMELLKEFSGEGGLHEFKDWWLKVQSGKDKDADNKSAFRKRFKKKFKDLFLPNEWPNPTVRDAYYHPTVDESEEPFKWGLPDLDALRDFLREELTWGQTKVDDLLVPIIQKMGRRGQASASNRQGNLIGYFDVTGGSGTHAPRRRQAYASKRLQQVVSDFRKKQKTSSSAPTSEGSDDSPSEEEETGPAKKKKKTATKTKTVTNSKTKPATRGTRGRGRGRGRGKASKTRSSPKDSSDEGDTFQRGASTRDVDVDSSPLAVQLRPRPKPAYKGAPKEGEQESASVLTSQG